MPRCVKDSSRADWRACGGRPTVAVSRGAAALVGRAPHSALGGGCSARARSRRRRSGSGSAGRLETTRGSRSSRRARRSTVSAPTRRGRRRITSCVGPAPKTARSRAREHPDGTSSVEVGVPLERAPRLGPGRSSERPRRRVRCRQCRHRPRTCSSRTPNAQSGIGEFGLDRRQELVATVDPAIERHPTGPLVDEVQDPVGLPARLGRPLARAAGGQFGRDGTTGPRQGRGDPQLRAVPRHVRGWFQVSQQRCSPAGSSLARRVEVRGRRRAGRELGRACRPRSRATSSLLHLAAWRARLAHADSRSSPSWRSRLPSA